MISILNRRELYTGTDAEDAARVWSTLKAEGIPTKCRLRACAAASPRAARRHGHGRDGRRGALL